MARIKGVLSTSIEPMEIVIGERPIMIDFSKTLTTAEAQAAVRVRGERGVCMVSKKGRQVTWRPAGKLLPGRHTLVVNTLPLRRGPAKSDAIDIPFMIVDSKAKPPHDVVVESIERIALERDSVRRVPLSEIPRGKYFDMMKGRDRETGAPVELAYNERGRKVTPRAALRAMIDRSLPAGKVHPDLGERIEGLSSKAQVPVAVWYQFDEKMSERAHLELKNNPTDTMPPQVARERVRMAKMGNKVAAALTSEGSDVHLDPVAPVVYAELNRRQIMALQKHPEVKGLYLTRREGIDDLQNSIEIANSDDVHAIGNKGKGVRVAVWERGPDDTDDLEIVDRFDTSASAQTSSHSRLTHAIIKNTESDKPKGHAPACSLYSANSYDLDALRWAVKDRNCTVISQSFHRTDEQTEGTLSFDDIYKDWLTLHWPYPTIVQAAGNDISPAVEYVNHKGFNSLAVGSHDDDAASMATDSVYRNPTTPHRDRELPEICANGTGVSAAKLTSSGTSFAAPAVAGITALLQSTDTVLKAWPEGCRAILLAGAQRNIKDDTWWDDVRNNVDAADGTGAVDAEESYRIVKSRRSRNASATMRGWDIGTLRSSDFNSNGLSKFTYRVQVPELMFRGLFGPRHVKVALAWNGKITTIRDIIPWLSSDSPIASNLAVDLDLKIFDSHGNQVGYSGTWDNSYEIAEFDGKPGETYTIKIRRWSGTDSTWFGIGWTVTGGIRLVERIAPEELDTVMRVLEW